MGPCPGNTECHPRLLYSVFTYPDNLEVEVEFGEESWSIEHIHDWPYVRISKCMQIRGDELMFLDCYSACAASVTALVYRVKLGNDNDTLWHFYVVDILR